MSVLKTYLRKAYMMGTRYSGLSAMLRPALSGVGAILMLHHVRPEQGGAGLNRHLHVTPCFLEMLIDQLKGEGARFVSMDEAADRLASGHSDERFLAMTLDDGYRDNAEHAAPVFRAFDVPYSVFVSPGLIEGSADLWWELLELAVERNDAVTADTGAGPVTSPCRTARQKRYVYCVLLTYALDELDEDAQRVFAREIGAAHGIDRKRHHEESLMDWQEVRALAADPLATIGAHTVNHFNMRRLPRERAAEEMIRSADIIAGKLGERPMHFAFPYGNVDAAGPREVEIATDAGFRTAVTTRHGVLMPDHAHHMHALPRISLNGYYQRVSYIQTMLTGITMPAANYGRTLVTV